MSATEVAIPLEKYMIFAKRDCGDLEGAGEEGGEKRHICLFLKRKTLAGCRLEKGVSCVLFTVNCYIWVFLPSAVRHSFSGTTNGK